jgi:hypothetical protein
MDDLLDQLERMLRVLAETDERHIGLFSRRYRPNLSDLDLGSDYFVPEVGDKVFDLRQAILALVGDQHTQTFHG